MDIGFNTALVLLSVLSLGAACGIIGAYIMLYKKSLVSDAVSHATLPGIGIGFILALWAGLDDGRFLPFLLMGAAFTGYLASRIIQWISAETRLTEDSAISSTLSFFFGLGIVFFSLIQNLESGNRSGLDSFLLGQTSGINYSDALIISLVSLVAAILAITLHRHFIIQSFDANFAKLNGPRQGSIERMLSILMLVIVCTGLKTTGAILILALLIIPAGSARQCSDNNKPMIALSAAYGVISALSGALLSASYANIPTGASIVMCSFVIFAGSLMIKFATKALCSRVKGPSYD